MEAIFFALIVCLGLSFTLSDEFEHIGLTRESVQILLGVFLGLPMIRETVLPGNAMLVLQSLAEMAAIFLLFITGLKVNFHELVEVSRTSFPLSLFGVAVPGILGFAGMQALGYSALTSVAVGILLALPGEAITVEMLDRFKLLKARIGVVTLSANVLEYIYGIIGILLIIFIAGGDSSLSTLNLLLELVLFIFLCAFLGKIATHVLTRGDSPSNFEAAVIFLLIVAMFSEIFEFSAIAGAFVLGIMMQESILKREESETMRTLTTITYGLLTPFFFIHIGLNLNFSVALSAPLLTIMLLVVGIGAKVSSSFFMAAVLPEFTRYEANVVGWILALRGVVVLVGADYLLISGLIDQQIFSAIVTMVLATMILAPLVFEKQIHSLRKKRKIVSAGKKIAAEKNKRHGDFINQKLQQI